MQLSKAWVWNLCRQTTPSPGGLVAKGTKGKRRRLVPIIPENRPLVAERIAAVRGDPVDRLFTGPRGGRISTAGHRSIDRAAAALSAHLKSPKTAPGPKLVPEQPRPRHLRVVR